MATDETLPSIPAHHNALKLLIQNRGASIMQDQIGIGIFFGVRALMVGFEMFSTVTAETQHAYVRRL